MEQGEKAKELQSRIRESLRSRQDEPIDAQLLALHAEANSAMTTNRVERQKLFREVAAKLGEIPYVGDTPAPGANALGVKMGLVSQHGLLIEVRWVSFYDAPLGLPAMAEWLYALGCRQVKYDIEGTFDNGETAENEE
jgi:hypothetical protein